MNILFATDKLCLNPYPCELSESINRQRPNWYIRVDFDEFWYSDIKYDIIHLQWIEELCGWNTPDEKFNDKLLTRINFWKDKGAKIFCTIHNLYPHLFPGEKSNKLYSAVFEKADFLIHHGEISKTLFNDHYGNINSNNVIHAVIPHGLFTRFRKGLKRSDARKYLMLKAKDFAVLAFGRVRSYDENELILRSFRLLEEKKKKLIIPNYKFSESLLIRSFQKLSLLAERNVFAESWFVPEDKVPLYFISSDMVLIPRLQILNSGNLILGFFYEKVVVGPDIGVVGEILRKTGNPVFTPGDDISLSEAVNKGKKLSLEGKGIDNYNYAKENWSWDIVSCQHIRYYEMAIKEN